jgi:mono/diheme cytochrome c family protein
MLGRWFPAIIRFPTTVDVRSVKSKALSLHPARRARLAKPQRRGAPLKPRRLCLSLLFAAAFATVAEAETPIERGAYLVEGIANCGNCHAPQEPSGAVPLTPLSGGPAITTPVFTAYPPNITPDRETGIGTWTEAEIVTALREGRTPDGRMLRPPMPVPFYRPMSDQDAHAIAAYLLWRPPIANRSPPSQYQVPVPADYGPPLGSIAAPPTTDPIAYGAYLASMGHCMLCHTPVGPNGQRDYGHRLGAGGLVMDGVFGHIVTPNITPDKQTGLGTWSDSDIARVLTTGERPDGRRLASPMPIAYLARLTPDDRAALIAWLRSLSPIPSKVER